MTLLLWLLFASNVLREAAVPGGCVAGVQRPAWSPRCCPRWWAWSPVRVVLGIVLAFVGSRRAMGVRLGIVGLVLGAIVGAILGSVTFDTKGALAVALTIGLRGRHRGHRSPFAVRHGFDPGAALRAARAARVDGHGGGDQAVPRAPVAPTAPEGRGSMSDGTQRPPDAVVRRWRQMERDAAR